MPAANQKIRSLPVLGHTLEMARDPLRLFTLLSQQEGGMAPIKLGPVSGFLVSDPDILEQIFRSKAKHYTRKTNVYEAMVSFLGRGILTSEGEHWRKHRRVVQPAFHKKKLEAFSSAIVRITDQHLGRWLAEPSGEIDLSEKIMHLTLKIVSETLLGTRTDADAADIGRAVDQSQRYIEGVIRMPLIPKFIPTPRRRALKKAVEAMDRIAYSVIDARMASNEQHDDVLSMLIEARDEGGQPLPRKQIRDELITLMAAGHETTANSLSWTLFLLSRHPSIARRLVDEVAEVIGDRPPTFEDVAKLKFTRFVFDESLRLYPPAWVTGRIVAEAHELGGHKMEPGMLTLLSPFATQRSPRLWDNPEGFDPDRWEKLSERGALRHFTFFPFGGGARKCVGEAFAYLEATLILAMIAQRMHLYVVPGQTITPSPQVTLGIVGGLRMNVVPHA